MKSSTDAVISILRKAVNIKHEADASDMTGRFTSAVKMQDLAEKYTAGAPLTIASKGTYVYLACNFKYNLNSLLGRPRQIVTEAVIADLGTMLTTWRASALFAMPLSGLQNQRT